MARTLKTGWVTLATSGPVVHGEEDGRFIKKEWLQDMADTFNQKLYKPNIWPDHRRFMSGGSVLALKLIEAEEPELKGELQLLGILSPSDWLVNSNKNGEFKYPSIEVGENFMNTGKYYLRGIGVTDEPASVGVTELNFSVKGKEEKAFVISGQAFDLSEQCQEKKTLLKRLFSTPTDQPQDDYNMTEEQFNALSQSVTAIGDSLGQLAKRVEQFSVSAAPSTEEPTGSDQPSAVSVESFNKLQSDLVQLTEKFNTALNTENPGTQPPENIGEGVLEVI